MLLTRTIVEDGWLRKVWFTAGRWMMFGPMCRSGCISLSVWEFIVDGETNSPRKKNIWADVNFCLLVMRSWVTSRLIVHQKLAAFHDKARSDVLSVDSSFVSEYTMYTLK